MGRRPKRANFDLSHDFKFSMNFGDLVPVLAEEVVPGDSFEIETEQMIRLAPMISPVMHRVDAYIHYFFVPNRLLWPEWEDFITGKEDAEAPSLVVGNQYIQEGTIFDYIGLPTHLPAGSITINDLPLRAYVQIWYDYYRDQNLNSADSPPWLGGNVAQWPFKRAWEKDYFTSCLPWAQKGDPVTIPTQADIVYKDVSEAYARAGGQGLGDITSDAFGDVNISSERGRIENLDSVTNEIDINELRQATAIQRWLERNARAGSRYVETLLAHFGVKSDDARLQRAEYLGGGKSPIVISEVVNQTGFTDDEANALPQGHLAGHGLNVGVSNKAKLYAKEHGWLMAIMSVRPKTAYFQGLHRKFTRQLPYDYYWPEFANLGEQEVKNQELYLSTVGNDTTFGYQSRYAEYRYAPGRVAGEMRSTLDHWHMAQKFSTTPNLNEDFILCDPDERNFAVQDGNHKLWCQLYHKIQAKRPMPKHATPHL